MLRAGLDKTREFTNELKHLASQAVSLGSRHKRRPIPPGGPRLLQREHWLDAQVMQFGPFELRVDTAELRKHGIRIRLQSQPYQVLRALLRQPGVVVTREELRQELWPGASFGDFENGLNTAINRLRTALGDSAESPHYIETLARLGYRFVAPVRAVDGSNTSVPVRTLEEVVHASPAVPAAAQGKDKKRWTAAAMAAGSVAVVGAAVWWYFSAQPRTPTYHQITFRRGVVTSARFTPQGDVVYSAAWNSEDRSRVYLTDLDSPESRDLQFDPARLASVSETGQLALLKSLPGIHSHRYSLAVAPLHGEGPRTIAADVADADLTADGRGLCLIRRTDSGFVLEFPMGNVLYRSAGWLESPRVLPGSNEVVFLEHLLDNDDGGHVMIATASGAVKRLTSDWASISGLAWHPTRNEIWFSAARQGVNRDVYAVTRRGVMRHVASLATSLELLDISRAGRVLVARNTERLSMFAGDLKTFSVQEQSWFDWSRVAALSADGKVMLFDESGEGGGPNYMVYLHHLDTRRTERLGEGRALDLSPDARWAVTASRSNLSQLTVVSTVDGQRKMLNAPHFSYQTARFLPDMCELIVSGNREGGPITAYVQNIATGAMRAVPNTAGLFDPLPSPDGQRVAGRLEPSTVVIVDLSDGKRTVVDSGSKAVPVAWEDDKTLITSTPEEHGAVLNRLSLVDRHAETVRRLPVEPAAAGRKLACLVVSRNLTTFAYSQRLTSSSLFVVDGWQ